MAFRYFFSAIAQATKQNHSTPDQSNLQDDIFFDMDGLDGYDSGSRDAAMPESTQSDDEDIDNDDQEYGKFHFIFIFFYFI